MIHTMPSVLGIATLALVSQAGRTVRREEEVQQSIQGCDCTGSCSAGPSDDFKYDTCTTQGCGQDFCDYSEGVFDTQSAEGKESYYRDKLLANQQPSHVIDPIPLLKDSVFTTFDNYLPEMPTGRKKWIHHIGSVCEFELEVARHSPFTGLFASGKQRGFIRMSHAGMGMVNGMTPGIGIKMLRSGIHSGDFVVMHNTSEGQGWNFFERNMSNHIPAAKRSLVTSKFEQATMCTTQVGLSDLARYSRDGSEHIPPSFPFKLFFVPSSDAQLKTNVRSNDEFLDDLATFPVGTTLFSVYACQIPRGAESHPTDGTVADSCGNPFRLGELKTASKCLPSKYGDESYHIRHQRMEEDWAWRPDFFQSSWYDALEVCNGQESFSPADGPKPRNLKGMLDGDA